MEPGPNLIADVARRTRDLLGQYYGWSILWFVSHCVGAIFEWKRRRESEGRTFLSRPADQKAAIKEFKYTLMSLGVTFVVLVGVALTLSISARDAEWKKVPEARDGRIRELEGQNSKLEATRKDLAERVDVKEKKIDELQSALLRTSHKFELPPGLTASLNEPPTYDYAEFSLGGDEVTPVTFAVGTRRQPIAQYRDVSINWTLHRDFEACVDATAKLTPGRTAGGTLLALDMADDEAVRARWTLPDATAQAKSVPLPRMPLSNSTAPISRYRLWVQAGEGSRVYVFGRIIVTRKKPAQLTTGIPGYCK
jgi:hypothetical protein